MRTSASHTPQKAGSGVPAPVLLYLYAQMKKHAMLPPRAQTPTQPSSQILVDPCSQTALPEPVAATGLASEVDGVEQASLGNHTSKMSSLEEETEDRQQVRRQCSALEQEIARLEHDKHEHRISGDEAHEVERLKRQCGQLKRHLVCLVTANSMFVLIVF